MSDWDEQTVAAPATAEVVLPRLMTVKAVAAAFGRSERTINRWIARGLLDPVRVGRSVFLRADDVMDLITGRISIVSGSTADNSSVYRKSL